MLTFTKQDSIVIAVTLGIVLSVPFLVPAFYTSANITVLEPAASPLPNGNRAGHLAKRKDVGGGDGDAQWRGPAVDCGLYYGLPI
jgi:hypothetical protein